jgi:hypothetical protein
VNNKLTSGVIAESMHVNNFLIKFYILNFYLSILKNLIEYNVEQMKVGKNIFIRIKTFKYVNLGTLIFRKCQCRIVENWTPREEW